MGMMDLAQWFFGWIVNTLIDAVYNYLFFWLPLIILFFVARAVALYRLKRTFKKSRVDR